MKKLFLKMDIREEAQLFGFLGVDMPLYRVGKHTTVFPVHGCGDYFYESNGQTVCIAGAFFEQQEWYVRLLLEGEDRLMKNRETVCRGKMVSYHAVSEEWLFLADPELSPLGADRAKREFTGVDAAFDRAAACGGYSIFLSRENPGGNCTGTWDCTAYGFADDFYGAETDEERDRTSFPWISKRISDGTVRGKGDALCVVSALKRESPMCCGWETEPLWK